MAKKKSRRWPFGEIRLNDLLSSCAHPEYMSLRSTITRMLAPIAPWLLGATFAAANSPVQVINGPYEAKLSGYCRSITEKDAMSGSSGDFRVRKGGSLNATGNRHAIFVDDGASVVVTGQSSVVFVSRGGMATVGGRRNQIFAEPGGRVIIQGQAMIASVTELELKVNRNAEECQ